ncbi:MAG TPA: DUF4377 domain-containing protein [Prolixibacteraceae bacterium]|nr:DUF4377 domain-containing protein [Prolixibacteraceae bacterium]
MNKTFLIILAIISIGIISCKKDDNGERVRMRVNHYQQPVIAYDIFTGLAFFVQKGDEIGKDKWYEFYNSLSGFDYELGYVYEIEVLKKHIENPYIDAPNEEYSLIRVISKTKVPQETTFDIELTIKYPDAFRSLVIKENSKYSLMGKTEIDCSNLYDSLEEKINNQIGLIGTFVHVDDKTIRLINLKTQE